MYEKNIKTFDKIFWILNKYFLDPDFDVGFDVGVDFDFDVELVVWLALMLTLMLIRWDMTFMYFAGGGGHPTSPKSKSTSKSTSKPTSKVI